MRGHAKPTIAVAVTAAALFALALLSPADDSDADPAAALVASQALLEHGTFDLGVYADDPRLVHELERNYRVRSMWGGAYHAYLGVSLAAVPAVGAARLLGWDMLDPADEARLQNLLSALLVAVTFVLLYVMAKELTSRSASWVIALVTTCGSSLMSTHATGLWSATASTVIVCVFLVWLVRRESRSLALGDVAVGGSLLIVAFLLRPATAFLSVAFAVVLTRERSRWVGRLSAYGLASLVVVLLLTAAGVLEGLLPFYYTPRKLLRPDDPLAAIAANLLAPSRGLLVFSPFVILPSVALAARWRGALSSRAVTLVTVWVVVHFAGLAVKPTWWGGECFGARLTADLLPGLALVTAWAWEELARSAAGGVVRRLAVAVYLVLATLAVAVNSGRGLFAPELNRRWATDPSVDHHPALVFDWSCPQLAATHSCIDVRRAAIERPRLVPYRLGEVAAFDGRRLLFAAGWYGPEPGWGRWTRGSASLVAFELEAVDERVPHRLEIVAASFGPQIVTVELGGEQLGTLMMTGHQAWPYSLQVPPGVLRVGENRLRLDVPGARSAPGDSRTMGMALVSLRVVPAVEQGGEAAPGAIP